MAEPPSYPGAPRWVKVFAVIVIVLVLLFGGLRLFGVGGEHGPGRHAPSDDAGGQAPPSLVMENRAPPEGGRG
jgi:hypothetical protein